MHRLSLRNSERYRHVKIKTNGHVYFKEISCTAVDLAADIVCKLPKLLRYCRYCSRDDVIVDIAVEIAVSKCRDIKSSTKSTARRFCVDFEYRISV